MLTGEGTESLPKRAEKRRAAVIGLLAGAALVLAGGPIGTLAMNHVLRWLSPGGGTIEIPDAVVTAIFLIAFYGELVFLQASFRLIESIGRVFEPPRRPIANLVLLLVVAVEGSALLIATVLWVHYLGIAEFLFR